MNKNKNKGDKAANAGVDADKKEPPSKKKAPGDSNDEDRSKSSDKAVSKLPKPAPSVAWKNPIKAIQDIKGKMGKNDKDKGKEGKKATPQPILKRAGPEDIAPPDAKKTKSQHGGDEEDLVRPRSTIASIAADCRRRKENTRRRNSVLGLGATSGRHRAERRNKFSQSSSSRTL